MLFAHAQAIAVSATMSRVVMQIAFFILRPSAARVLSVRFASDGSNVPRRATIYCISGLEGESSSLGMFHGQPFSPPTSSPSSPLAPAPPTDQQPSHRVRHPARKRQEDPEEGNQDRDNGDDDYHDRRVNGNQCKHLAALQASPTLPCSSPELEWHFGHSGASPDECRCVGLPRRAAGQQVREHGPPGGPRRH